MSLYPRLLWSPDGVEITVGSETEEAAKVAEGYRLTCDPPTEPPAELPEPEPEPESEPPTFGAADDGTGEEPTECPPDDQSHTKRSRKKK